MKFLVSGNTIAPESPDNAHGLSWRDWEIKTYPEETPILLKRSSTDFALTLSWMRLSCPCKASAPCFLAHIPTVIRIVVGVNFFPRRRR